MHKNNLAIAVSGVFQPHAIFISVKKKSRKKRMCGNPRKLMSVDPKSSRKMRPIMYKERKMNGKSCQSYDYFQGLILSVILPTLTKILGTITIGMVASRGH